MSIKAPSITDLRKAMMSMPDVILEAMKDQLALLIGMLNDTEVAGFNRHFPVYPITAREFRIAITLCQASVRVANSAMLKLMTASEVRLES